MPGRAMKAPPCDLPPLSQSARTVIEKLARMLSEGFTGEVELQCSDGGIKIMRSRTTYRPDDEGGDDIRQSVFG